MSGNHSWETDPFGRGNPVLDQFVDSLEAEFLAAEQRTTEDACTIKMYAAIHGLSEEWEPFVEGAAAEAFGAPRLDDTTLLLTHIDLHICPVHGTAHCRWCRRAEGN